MKLPKAEYEFFNALTEQEFRAVAKTDFERYHNFILNESMGNKEKRHKRFDEARKKAFELAYNCVPDGEECPHRNCENRNYKPKGGNNNEIQRLEH